MEKIIYIQDSAIDLTKNDLLGTRIYVELLEETIKNCSAPYTIGLFGSWGSGKSSIIKTLQNKHSDEKNVFIYDAWKYSKDDFRRTFILELRNFFNLKIDKEKELLYKDKTEEVKFKPKFDIYSVIILIFSFIFTFLLGIFLFKLEIKGNIFGSFSFSFFITFIHSVFRSIVIYHKVSITSSKIFSPEQFEERFEKSIKESKCKNVIIAIDNIDRCYKEQVMEILLTVKNFLEKPNVIFIIPLDENGLRSYMQMSYQDANEFIRKIFTSTIYIKNYSDSELYDFGIKLCDKYKIKLPKKENVISILTQEFTKNPRKIIQFINILQTELYLATKQEVNGLIPKGSITDNIEMLVKILIIRDEYSELYQKIKDNKSILQEINQHINNNEFSIDKEGMYYKDNIKLNIYEYRFLLRTLHIEIEKSLTDSFFVIKDTFKDIPDEFYPDIISQNWEKLKKDLLKIKLDIKKLIEFIDKLIDENIIKRELYDTSGFNLISLIFKIIADYYDKIDFLPKNILSVLNRNQIWKNLFNFPPKELAITIKWFKEKQKVNLINKFIEEFNKIEPQKVDEKHKCILINIITVCDIEDIKDNINKLFNILNDGFEIFNMIPPDKALFLITDDFIKSKIPGLTQDYNKNKTIEIVNIMKLLKDSDILGKDTIKSYVEICIKNIDILQNYNQPKWFEFWINNLFDFIDKIDDNNTLNNIYKSIDNNIQFFKRQFNISQFNSDYISSFQSYLKLISELYLKMILNNKLDESKNLIDWINIFLNYNISDVISDYVIEMYKMIITRTKKADILINVISNFVSQNDYSIKDKIFQIMEIAINNYIDLSLYQKNTSQLILHIFSLFSSNSNIISYIKDWLYYLVKDSTCRKEVINQIFSKDPKDLKDIIPIIIDLDLFEDRNFKEDFMGRIKEYLAIEKTQQIGINILDFIIKIRPSFIEYKKDIISSLLREIKNVNIDNETNEKLKELKSAYKLKSEKNYRYKKNIKVDK